MTDDLVKRLRAGDNGQELEAADYIEHLQEMLLAARLMMAGMAKDLTQSSAETAAVIEWAEEWGIHKCGCRFYDIAVCDCGLSTLSTPDQSAALDAVRAEAWENGMREAAVLAYQFQGNDKLRLHILAAIKGAKA